MDIDELSRRVYKVFSPSPLTVEQNDLYVNLDDVRGDADIVKRLTNVIRLSDGSFTHQVLAGHRGCGKSTELTRIRTELQTGKPKYFVVYCDAYENLDLNDVDFPDLLLEMVRQIADALRNDAKIELRPSYPKEVIERVGKFLHSDVNLGSFEIGNDLAKISGTIRNSPDMRAKIREVLEPHTDSLLNAANDLISKAALELYDKGYAGIVLLVDNLDKMPLRAKENSSCDTAEYLFVNRAAQLTAIKCHVIYTIPLSLAYSHLEQAIKSQYEGHLPVVPATKIAGRPPFQKPFSEGIAKFKAIVDRRLKSVGVSKDEVFASDEVLLKIIALSGGQPTELMTIIREAIITGSLPITAKALSRAEKEGQREYARILLAEHIDIINEVALNGEFARKAETEDAFREVLNSRAILQYVNDEEWYGLNPMVTELINDRKQGKE